MESDLPLIEIAEEDDSLLQQFPDLNQTPCKSLLNHSTFSPFALPPSHAKYLKDGLRMEKPNSSSCEVNNNKENINLSSVEVPKLGMEPVQMKRKKKGAGYNLRKSLAWDKAFFTDEGILDPSELTLITGIDAGMRGGELSTISEEGNSSFSSDVKCTNESNDIEASEEAPLKELRDKNRTPKGNREKTDCLMRNRGSLLNNKVVNKVLSSDRANRVRPKVGGCSEPLAASSLKRPANSSTLKTASKESKIPRIPISKPGSCSNANNATIKGSMAASQLRHNSISKPTKNVEKNFGLKSSLQKAHGSQSKPKSISSNLHLPLKELAKRTTKNLTQSSKPASSTRSRLVQVDGANSKSEMLPGASAPLAAKHFAQHAAANSNNSLSEAARLTSSRPCHIQGASKGLMISDRLNSCENQDRPGAIAKPSGLRLPSPSLRLFDLRTSFESGPLQQQKAQQYMGSDRKYGDTLPPARPPMKSNDITENVCRVALTPGKEFHAPVTQSSSTNYVLHSSTKQVPDLNVYQNLVKNSACCQLVSEGRAPETIYKPGDELQSYNASSMSAYGGSIQHQEETKSTGVDDLDHAQTSWEQADLKKFDDAPLKVVNLDHAQTSWEQENDVSKVVHDVTDLKDEADATDLKDEADATELKGVNTSCIPCQSLNTEQRDDDADCVDVFLTKSPRVRDPSAELQDSSSCEGLNIKPTPIENPPSTEGRDPATKYKYVHNEEDGLQSYAVSSMPTFGQSNQHQEDISTGVDDLDLAQTSWEQADSAKSADASPKVNSKSHLDACSQVFADSHEKYGIENYSGVLQHEQENDVSKVVDGNGLPVEEGDSYCNRTISIGFRDSHSLEDEVGSISCFEATTPCISALPNSQLSEELTFHNVVDINDHLYQEKSVSSDIVIEVPGQKQDGVDVDLISREVAPLIEFISETASVGDDALVKSESVLQGAHCTDTYPQSSEKERLDIAAPTVEAQHIDNQKSLEMGIFVVAEISQHSHGNISETEPTVQGCTGGPETHSQFQSENQTLEGSDSMLEEKTSLLLEMILDSDDNSDASAQILPEENSEENSKSVQGCSIVVPEEYSDASAQILPVVQVNGDNQPQGFVGTTDFIETHDYFTNGKSDSSYSVGQELSTGVETTSTPESCCLIGTKTSYMIEAEESIISNGEQVDATLIDGGFLHEIDDIKDHKDATVLNTRSNSIKKKDNSLVIPPSNTAPSSDEWLASFEAAGQLLMNEYKEEGLQSYTASSMSSNRQPIQHQEEIISTMVDDLDNAQTSVNTEKSDDTPPKVSPGSHLDADSQVFVESREQDVVRKREDYVGITKCVAPGIESYSVVLPHGQESGAYKVIKDGAYKVVKDNSLPMEEHDITELKGVGSSSISFQSLNTEQRNDDADCADIFSTTTKLPRETDPSAELHDSPSSKGLNIEHKLPVTLVLHDNQSSTEGLHFIPANSIKNTSQLQYTDTAKGSMNCFEATTSCISASVSCITPEESSCLEEGTFHNVTAINDHFFREKNAEFISETASVGDDTPVQSKSVLQGAQFTGTNLQSLEKERLDIATPTVEVQHQILEEYQPQGFVWITHPVETHDCFTNGKSTSSFPVSQDPTSTPEQCCLVGTETTFLGAEVLKINNGEQADATPIMGGFQHELDDLKDHKDATMLTRSNSIERQDDSLVIHPSNAIPFSDECLADSEAAGKLLMNEYEENGLQSYTASSISTFGQSNQHQKETISTGTGDLDHAQTPQKQVDTKQYDDTLPKVNPESHLEAGGQVFVELLNSPVRDTITQLFNKSPIAEPTYSTENNQSSTEATTPCISAEEDTCHNVTDISDHLYQEKRASSPILIGPKQDVDLTPREVAPLINELVSETASVGDDAEGSKISIEEQVDATLIVGGFQHEADDLKDHYDATVLTKGSNSIKRQDKSLAICPPNAVPFSDEWLAAIEAAGEEILTLKCGAVQHSPPDKSLPEPSPWSPVKKKGNQIGPYDCTKYTNAMPTGSQVSDQ